jgi:hypothetical protein
MENPMADTNRDRIQASTHVHDQAGRLADRLGMPELLNPALARWERLIFPALHALLDRIEALERGDKPPEAFNGG